MPSRIDYRQARLTARLGAFRFGFHEMRRRNAHRHVDAHQGLNPDIGRLDPRGGDINQRAADWYRRRWNKDYVVRLPADDDRFGHWQQPQNPRTPSPPKKHQTGLMLLRPSSSLLSMTATKRLVTS